LSKHFLWFRGSGFRVFDFGYGIWDCGFRKRFQVSGVRKYGMGLGAWSIGLKALLNSEFLYPMPFAPCPVLCA